MLPSVSSVRRSAPVRQLLWWLVLAMLLAPALGRVHQLLHPPAWQGQPALGQPALGHGHLRGDAGAAPAAHAAHAATSGDWLLALFVGHSHSDCQLHDQLNAWASPPVAAPALPAALPQEPPRQLALRAAFAGSAAFFDPRAPPAAAA